jgi:hypothetical protein
MERDELSRLREEFERLYRQRDLPTDLYASIDAIPDARSDRTGFLRTLQRLWRRASAFLMEEVNDSAQGHLTWWQMHRLRTAAYTPSISPDNPDQARDRLERIYRQ